MLLKYSHMNMETVLGKMNQWKGLNPTKDALFLLFCLLCYQGYNNIPTAAGIKHTAAHGPAETLLLTLVNT